MLQLEISNVDVLRIVTEDRIEYYPGIITRNKVFSTFGDNFEQTPALKCLSLRNPFLVNPFAGKKCLLFFHLFSFLM